MALLPPPGHLRMHTLIRECDVRQHFSFLLNNTAAKPSTFMPTSPFRHKSSLLYSRSFPASSLNVHYTP